MDTFKILKIQKEKEYFSILLHDEKEKHNFWIDCSLIDGYGNKKNYKTSDLYIDWEFNQYIFDLYNEKDIQAKKYQEKSENLEKIQLFLDENNDSIIENIKEVVL